MSSTNFHLITTIRYDSNLLSISWNSTVNYGQPSPFMLLPYHFDRLKAAATLHGWQDTITSISWASFLLTCQHAVQAYNGPAKAGPLKLRLVLQRAGTLSTSVEPTPPIAADPMLAAYISPLLDSLPRSLGDPIALFIDIEATPSSLFTATKTTYRSHYATARARLGLPDVGGPADVLLWNTKGMLTETSVRNFALFRHGRWVTPHDSTGCLQGITRRWLLERGLIATDEQGRLHKNSVQEGELVLLFNAVEGCRIGVAHLRKA